MPISMDEFRKGNIIYGSSKIVLNFLKLHNDQAFTQDKIIKSVNLNPSAESFIRFLAAMAPLQHHDLVERRELPTPKSPELYYPAT
jgi:hypothetical protein